MRPLKIGLGLPKLLLRDSCIPLVEYDPVPLEDIPLLVVESGSLEKHYVVWRVLVSAYVHLSICAAQWLSCYV
jgi:hypothetical protein